jgi:hypothetical protein
MTLNCLDEMTPDTILAKWSQVIIGNPVDLEEKRIIAEYIRELEQTRDAALLKFNEDLSGGEL